jgi:cell division protein FtsL|tara:strand:+ start:1747 stop:2013 length:267 start_codon:yes stop_codon:yes gene_type:complete
MNANYLLILFIQISLILFLSFEQIKVRWEISLLYGNQDKINLEYQNLKEEQYKLKTEVYFLNSPARVEKYAKEKLSMQKIKPKIVKIQ